MKFPSSLKFCLLNVFFIFCAVAQRDLATLVGTVTDSTGSGVPNAKVSISEEATGLRYDLVTTSGGEFARPALKPGIYVIQVEAAGFKKATRRNVSLTAGDRTGVDFALQIGEVTTNIEVSADGAVLQTESTIIGASVDSKQVGELPLGGVQKLLRHSINPGLD